LCWTRNKLLAFYSGVIAVSPIRKKMTEFKQGVFHLLTIFSLLTLASCGGGDSSDGIVAEKKTPVTTINPSTINFIPHLSFGEKVSLIFPESWKKQDSSAFGAPEIIAAFSEPPEIPSDRFLA
jgi:hypothetical protein